MVVFVWGRVRGGEVKIVAFFVVVAIQLLFVLFPMLCSEVPLLWVVVVLVRLRLGLLVLQAGAPKAKRTWAAFLGSLPAWLWKKMKDILPFSLVGTILTRSRPGLCGHLLQLVLGVCGLRFVCH